MKRRPGGARNAPRAHQPGGIAHLTLGDERGPLGRGISEMLRRHPVPEVYPHSFDCGNLATGGCTCRITSQPQPQE